MPESEEGKNRGSNVPIPEFEGGKDSNFTSWLARFNIIFDSNNWPEQRKASTLAAHLAGNAFHEYLNLTEAVRADYTELVKALSSKVCGDDQRRY